MNILLTNLARKIIHKALHKIQDGQLILREGGSVFVFGNPESLIKETITIDSAVTYQYVLFDGTNGAAESYIKGYWHTQNLPGVLKLFLVNDKSTLQAFEKGINSIKTAWFYLSKLFQTSIAANKKNIAYHYDLGNDFFFAFLDQTKQYSCALFNKDTNSLHEASINKLNHICKQMNIKPGDKVLEIGCGWGALTEYLARNFKCDVTAITISEAQYEHCKKRFKAAEVKNNITLLLTDYRLVTGLFDKIVSIEMIEAVGEKNLGTFFKQVNKLLRPKGELFLQMILMNNANYKNYRSKIDFIQKYIFPGGHLPCQAVINKLVSELTSFQSLQWEDITSHYPLTLKHWQDRFNKSIPEKYARNIALVRTWKFYFAYCRIGFEEKFIQTIQAKYIKG